MALITDYASLQSNVALYLKRKDLTEQIKTFIQLGESRMFTEPELNLKDREVETVIPTIIDEPDYTIPSDAKALRHIKINISATITQNLIYMPIERFDDEFQTLRDTERLFYPVAWKKLGLTQFTLGPKPRTVMDMTITYYQKWANLSDAAPTNNLLTTYPGLYLYAVLAETPLYLVDDQRLQAWAGMYATSRDRIIEHERKRRRPPGGDQMYTEISDTLYGSFRGGYLYR